MDRNAEFGRRAIAITITGKGIGRSLLMFLPTIPAMILEVSL
jgi:hypothetical protein